MEGEPDSATQQPYRQPMETRTLTAEMILDEAERRLLEVALPNFIDAINDKEVVDARVYKLNKGIKKIIDGKSPESS